MLQAMTTVKASKTAKNAHGLTPKIGRPSLYSETVGAIILGRMVEGESLRSVCRDPALPDRSTVYQWMNKNPSFAAQYARAREALVEHWADEIIEIADDGTTDYVTKVGRNGTEYEAVDQEHIQRSRLRVDARRWLMSKLKPGVYGDRVEVEQTGSVTVVHELSDRERMRRFALFMLEQEAKGQAIEGEVIEPSNPPASQPENAEPNG